MQYGKKSPEAVRCSGHSCGHVQLMLPGTRAKLFMEWFEEPAKEVQRSLIDHQWDVLDKNLICVGPTYTLLEK